jgi:hypothetical protein
MLSVEVINHFLYISGILRRFPASLYVTVTCPLYELTELPVVSLGAEDLVHFEFVRVVHNCPLWFRWRLAGGRQCIVVEQRDVEHSVVLHHIRKV